MVTKQPPEIARETIRQLAARRIAPTPDHYRELYAEIAGTPLSEAFPDKAMKQLATTIGRASTLPGLERTLQEAVAAQDWDAFEHVLADHLADLAAMQRLPWKDLIHDLLRQWENDASRHTTAQKREALERTLQSAGVNPSTLFTRLETLHKQWAQARDGEALTLNFPAEATPSETRPASSGERTNPAPDFLADFRRLFVFTLENCLRAFLRDDQRLIDSSNKLVEEIRYANTPKQLQALQQALKNFAFRLELLDEDQREMRESLLKLLRLAVGNVGELVLNDQWIHGQVEILREIVERPLSQKSLDDAERRLKEVVFKQSQLKLGLQEAQDAMKHMLAGFVDHLNDFAGATSEYHDKIGAIAERISHADNLLDLESVLAEVMRETRHIQNNARTSRDELFAARSRVQDAEARVRSLEQELAATSELVRHDQLTGVLNRRGLEEMCEKEIRRCDRRQEAFCLAMLDLDNFKKLNDVLGHAGGDEALLHLTHVVRETLRPQDSVARFGGEEFVILFPDTDINQAAIAMTRIQRELTRQIFLYNNQKLLITFSAGIARRRPGEMQESLIKRADAAMYQAKHSGKNRVELDATDLSTPEDGHSHA